MSFRVANERDELRAALGLTGRTQAKIWLLAELAPACGSGLFLCALPAAGSALAGYKLMVNMLLCKQLAVTRTAAGASVRVATEQHHDLTAQKALKGLRHTLSNRYSGANGSVGHWSTVFHRQLKFPQSVGWLRTTMNKAGRRGRRNRLRRLRFPGRPRAARVMDYSG